MSNTYHTIQEKIGNIQSGMLRFREDNVQQSIHVKVAVGENDLLYCLLNDNEPLASPSVGTVVHLIQKHKDDYLFITGEICATAKASKQVLSVRVIKACWFERQLNGSVSWFLEKHVYEMDQERQYRLAS